MLNNESFSFTVDFPAEQMESLEMEILDQGTYNWHALCRDGYLSSKNCWKSRGFRANASVYDDYIGDLSETLRQMQKDFEEYEIKHFKLPDDWDLARDYIVGHIEAFLYEYDMESPVLYMNNNTAGFIVKNSLDLGDCQEDISIDHANGLFGRYEGCDVALDNDLKDMEVELR